MREEIVLKREFIPNDYPITSFMGYGEG